MYLSIDVTYLSIHDRILRAIFDGWGHGSGSRGYSPGLAVIPSSYGVCVCNVFCVVVKHGVVGGGAMRSTYFP